jgi:hypothetical protein
MNWLAEHGRTAGVGLLVLTLVILGGWQLLASAQGQSAPANTGPKTTPPLDLLAPAQTKTATFALG